MNPTGKNLLASVLLNTIFFSTFVALFFFIYGAYIEQQIVKTQTIDIVDDFFRDIKQLVPGSALKTVAPLVDKLLTVPDMTQKDQEVKDKNNSLFKTASVVVLIGNFILLVAFFLIAKNTPHFPMQTIVKQNLITLAAVAVTEVSFLTFVAQNYCSSDPNSIKLEIIETLQNYARGTHIS